MYTKMFGSKILWTRGSSGHNEFKKFILSLVRTQKNLKHPNIGTLGPSFFGVCYGLISHGTMTHQKFLFSIVGVCVCPKSMHIQSLPKLITTSLGF